VEVWLNSFLTSALEGGVRSASRPGRGQRVGLRKLPANRYDDFLWPALCKKYSIMEVRGTKSGI